MGENEKLDLSDIHFKYERIASLIGIMSTLAAEVVEVSGIPKEDFANSLLEVELEIKKNNERLEKAIQRKG